MKKLSQLKPLEQVERLYEVAKELQDLLDPDPPIKVGSKIIDKIKPGELKAADIPKFKKVLEEAAGLLDPSGEDKGQITPLAQSVIEELGFDTVSPFPSPVKEEQEEPEEVQEAEEVDDGINIEAEINEAKKMKELKDIARTYGEFKALRNNLASYSSVAGLKKVMLQVLSGELKIKETAKPEKQEKKQTKKKTSKSKGTGVIATIVDCIEKVGKKGISKEEILKILVEKFPDREPEAMQKTVNVQVPNRITKERFEVSKTKDGNYFKA